MHVDPDSLRDAADKTRDASDLDDYDFDVDHVDPQTLGHLELTDWLMAVLGQCNNAGRALHDGVYEIAEALDLTAGDVEDTDHSIEGSFIPFERADESTPVAAPVPAPLTTTPTPGTVPDFSDLLFPETAPEPDTPAPVLGPPAEPTIRDILLGENAPTTTPTTASEEDWHAPMAPPAEEEVLS
jgi:hypothetical protein